MSMWVDAMLNRGVAEVAAAFGLKVVRRTITPCPACDAEKRGSNDPRGPIGLRTDGTGWECHRCHQKGNSLHLAAAVVTGTTAPPQWGVVRDQCIALGLVHRSMPFAKPDIGPGGVLGAIPRPTPPAPRRPPVAEVWDLWERCRPVVDDASVRSWIEGRGLEAELMADDDYCRALPTSGALPKWARYMGRSWRESQHRVIVPLYGAGGQMESLHARSVDRDAAPKDKAASPTGAEVRGLVMANLIARRLFPEWPAPKNGLLDINHGYPMAVYKVKVLIAEGVPDFLTWCQRRPNLYGYSEGDPREWEHWRAVFGVIAGSWTPEIAATIPDGSRVTIRTHHDEAGNKYAEKIRETLEGRVTLLRSRAPENAGTEVRGNDETQGR